jgi:hypothetical protein
MTADCDTVELFETNKRKTFSVNEQNSGILDIIYGKVKQSLYSSTSSVIYCRSYETCISMAGNNEIRDRYNVFEDGLTVRGLSKND